MFGPEDRRHPAKMIAKGLAFALLFAAFVLLAALVVMFLWNTILPDVTGWKALTFRQALGLLVLSRILFGGRHGGRRWRKHRERHHTSWRDKWRSMSDEVREKLRSDWRSRCGWEGPQNKWKKEEEL